jgi:hypothetical protein
LKQLFCVEGASWLDKRRLNKVEENNDAMSPQGMVLLSYSKLVGKSSDLSFWIQIN